MAALKDRTIEFSGSMQNMTLSVKTTQKAPSMMYQETGMMGQTMEFKLEKFEVNTGVKDALFQKPAK